MHGTTGEWIDYTGSDEQICDMLTSDVKFTVDSNCSIFGKILVDDWNMTNI